MRIGIISQWYEPEPGPAALPAVMARALAARGHEVCVLTGFPNYPSGSIFPAYRQRLLLKELMGGVEVFRTPLFPSHDGSAGRRIANYVSFAISATLAGIPFFPRVDVLWVNYSPVTVAVPMWLEQLLHGTPAVCEVADLWPDTLAVSGISGSSRLLSAGRGWLDKWCARIYASSDAVVHISPSVGNVLGTRGVPRHKLKYIPKPANELLFHNHGNSIRAELGIDENAIVLLYAGSMGAAQGLEALIEACSLIEDDRFVMLMAGSGLREDALRRQAKAVSPRNVRFLGRVPQESMSDLMATADAAFISLEQNPLSEMTMPSKTQVALACGRAVLVAGSGDVAEVVSANGVGFIAVPGSAPSIAGAIGELVAVGRGGLMKLGATARRLYEDEFSMRRTTTLIEDLLEEVVVAAGRPQRCKGLRHD